MRERIQKILSSRGVASRRKAEEMISAGRITCNGTVCQVGMCADPQKDEVLVDGNPLPSMGKRTYLMLNKPRGYVTTLSDEKGRPNASQLVADCGKRVYPVGRLDMDSEGLLIFTDDGDLANKMMHPSHQVNKTYLVTVRGFSDEGMYRLKQPLELDGYLVQPPKVKILSTGVKSRLLITIHEGRNRQVRRMCAAAHMDVCRLIRIQEGTLELGKLPLGKWRYLTDEEVRDLQE